MNVQNLKDQAAQALNASKAAAAQSLSDAKQAAMDEIAKLKGDASSSKPADLLNKLKDGELLDELKGKAGDVLNVIADKASGLADKLGK